MASFSSPLVNLPEDSITVPRASLYESREAFTERISPVGVAAIFFGATPFGTRDMALSRQALLKLSYAFRHVLSPVGYTVHVEHHTARFQEENSPSIFRELATILTQQIGGIREVVFPAKASADLGVSLESERERLQAALHLDQQGNSKVSVQVRDGKIELHGAVATAAEESALSQLAQTVCRSKIASRLELDATLIRKSQPDVDDDSLQAFVLFRLRLAPELKAGKVRVSANRGEILLQGKAQTESELRTIEQLARTTLGVVRLRNSLTLLEPVSLPPVS